MATHTDAHTDAHTDTSAACAQSFRYLAAKWFPYTNGRVARQVYQFLGSVKEYRETATAVVVTVVAAGSHTPITKYSSDSRCTVGDVEQHVAELQQYKTRHLCFYYPDDLRFETSLENHVVLEHPNLTIVLVARDCRWEATRGLHYTGPYRYWTRFLLVQWHPDNVHIATLTASDRKLRIINTDTFTHVTNFQHPQRKILQTIAWSADGVYLAAGNYTEVLVWNYKTQQLHCTIPTGNITGRQPSMEICWVPATHTFGTGVPHTDHSHLAVSTDRVCVFNMDTLIVEQRIKRPFHLNRRRSNKHLDGACTYWHPTKPLVAILARDVQVWDTDTWQFLHRCPGYPQSSYLGIGWHPTQPTFAVALNFTYGQPALFLLEVQDGVCSKTKLYEPPHGAHFFFGAWNPTGNFIALRIMALGTCVFPFLKNNGLQVVENRIVDRRQCKTDSICRDVVWNRNGTKFVSTGHKGNLILYELV